jgi:hypothetical protein
VVNVHHEDHNDPHGIQGKSKVDIFNISRDKAVGSEKKLCRKKDRIHGNEIHDDQADL